MRRYENGEMNHGSLRLLLLALGALAGYAIFMQTQPTHASFRDGWRCVARYKRLCLIPFLFAGFHAAFALWVRFDEARTIPGAPPVLMPWAGWHPAAWREVLAASWLPAMESVASIFNCAVTTFPLSALGGLLFLCNWRGYQMLVSRGLRRRFGLAPGLMIYAVLLACALAACAKPVLFGRNPWLSGLADETTFLRIGEGINWASFLFEYVIGVGIQIYLLLLAFTWVRGLTFDFEGLGRLALRRWVVVFKWAGVLLLVSSIGIHLPLLLSKFTRVTFFGADAVTLFVASTRWLLAFGLLILCSVQIFLVFHNETLWHALRAHFRLLGRHGWQMGWFMAVATIHFLLLAASNTLLPQALGDWTWPSVCWKTLVYPLCWAVLSAWSLAAWVCLFRRFEAGVPEADNLVRF